MPHSSLDTTSNTPSTPGVQSHRHNMATQQFDASGYAASAVIQAPTPTARRYPLAQKAFQFVFWLLSPKTQTPYHPRLNSVL